MLTLVAASYVEGPPAMLTLTFDRAVNVASFDGSQVIVDDGVLGVQYLAGGATLLDPETVEIELVELGPGPGSDVRLNATADTGIVSVAGGLTWAGATSLLLPFP